MMIKDGYQNKSFEITIRKHLGSRNAEVWIKQMNGTETLSYATIDELMNLKNEINSTLESI